MNKENVILKKCQKELNVIKANLVKEKIFLSNQKVITKLLKSDLLLQDFCVEIEPLLSNFHLPRFLDYIVDIIAGWSPENAKKERGNIKLLDEINKKISEHAYELADLMRKRMEICNSSGVSCDYVYSTMDLVNSAGQKNHNFTKYIEKDLTNLLKGYDLKYFPTPADLIFDIGDNSKNLKVLPQDNLTAVSIKSNRSSKTDLVRVLLEALNDDEVKTRTNCDKFSLTDKALSSLINAYCDDSEKNVGSDYIKNIRHKDQK